MFVGCGKRKVNYEIPKRLNNQLSAKSGRRLLAWTTSKSSLAFFVIVKGASMPRRNYLLLTIRDQSDKIKVWDAHQHKYHLYAEISRTSHLKVAIPLARF
jgi:hypothetical protein